MSIETPLVINQDEQLYNEGLEKNKIKDHAELLAKIEHLKQEIKKNEDKSDDEELELNQKLLKDLKKLKKLGD